MNHRHLCLIIQSVEYDPTQMLLFEAHIYQDAWIQVYVNGDLLGEYQCTGTIPLDPDPLSVHEYLWICGHHVAMIVVENKLFYTPEIDVTILYTDAWIERCYGYDSYKATSEAIQCPS